MPINFVTGLPRQGKTLWTLQHVQDRAKAESRTVYTCNIPEVTIEGWQEIDHPDKWMELPNDSIIVVDELQDFWGMASSGARVPLPILELSKHGKRGIDFYFITQDPTLVHQTPRKLCETHYHVVRAFGSENAMVHKWPRMQTDPEKVKSKSEKLPWRYPKQAFGKKDKAGNWITKPWYKSADVHNIKRQIPLKVWAIPGAALLAVLAIWGGIKLFGGVLDKARGGAASASAAATAPGAQPPSSAAASGGAGPGGSGAREPKTPAQYVADYKPRIPGFPHSAPAYDQVTQPVEAPYPAACVAMGKRCDCYTQQATQMTVPKDVCLQIVRKGYFVDWRMPQREQPSQRQARAEQPAHGAQPVPALPMVQLVPAPSLLNQVQQLAQQQPEPEGYLQSLARRNAQVRSTLLN